MARRPGRPSALTPEVREGLLQAFRLGATVKIACGAMGVGETSFYRWMARGESATSGQYREFWQDVNVARDRGDLELLALVRKASKKDGRLALELLSRRHPKAYARQDRTTVRHEGHDGGPVKVAAVVANLGDLTPDQLRAMLAEAPSTAADVIDATPAPAALPLKEVS